MDGATGDGGVDQGVTVELVAIGPNGQPVETGDPIDFTDFSVDSITVQLHDLGLVGDNAPADLLVVPSRAMQYPLASVMEVPYPSAPPGLYSRFDFRVERTYADEEVPDGFQGQRLSVRVLGTAHNVGPSSNKDRAFDYVDDQAIEISLDDVSEEVKPGVPGFVQIGLGVQQWFSGVSWSDLDAAQNGNGPIKIGMDGDTATGDALRAARVNAFYTRE
jgi:hypothetical protein